MDRPLYSYTATQRRTTRSRLGVVFALAALFATTLAARAQGGPPFRTDDPDTPGNRHWEINFGWVGDRNLANGAYQTPDVDINYGLGSRIQLKYEIPIAIEETRSQAATSSDAAVAGHVIGGLGESQPGIKWRFYEHHSGDPALRGRFGTGLLALFANKPTGDATDDTEKPTDLSFSTYPQLTLNNPTRSVARGVVAAGPNFFLPLSFNARVGPIRINGEVGYNFGNHDMAQSWVRGLLVGHEFSDSTEAYAEIFDQQDANRVHADDTKARETTLGLGGRQALNRAHTLNLLLMGGRSFQTVAATNTQPSWIAYVGVQVLFGPK